MSDKNMTIGLLQTWMPVTDSDGRTRLEAHWVSASSAPAGVSHAA